MNRVSIDMNKLNDLVDVLKSGNFVRKQEVVVEEKKSNPVVTILAIVGIVVAIAAIVYAVYCYFTPDYLEDFEDDFDDFDDLEDDEDFFEDEDTDAE